MANWQGHKPGDAITLDLPDAFRIVITYQPQGLIEHEYLVDLIHQGYPIAHAAVYPDNDLNVDDPVAIYTRALEIKPSWLNYRPFVEMLAKATVKKGAAHGTTA